MRLIKAPLCIQAACQTALRVNCRQFKGDQLQLQGKAPTTTLLSSTHPRLSDQESFKSYHPPTTHYFPPQPISNIQIISDPEQEFSKFHRPFLSANKLVSTTCLLLSNKKMLCRTEKYSSTPLNVNPSTFPHLYFCQTTTT